MLANYGYIGLYLVFLVLLALIIILLPVLLRYVRVVPHNPSKVKNSIYECGMETIGKTWVQFNFRYYTYALLFIALDVMVVCYSDSPGYRDYLEAKHHLMLEWMRLAEDLGVGFAFPTQTLHVESLAALDSVPEVQVPADEMLGQTVAGYGPDGERGTPRTPDVSAGFWPEEPEE